MYCICMYVMKSIFTRLKHYLKSASFTNTALDKWSKDGKFSKEELKIANKYFKKYLFINVLRNRNESNNQILAFQKDED